MVWVIVVWEKILGGKLEGTYEDWEECVKVERSVWSFVDDMFGDEMMFEDDMFGKIGVKFDILRWTRGRVKPVKVKWR